MAPFREQRADRRRSVAENTALDTLPAIASPTDARPDVVDVGPPPLRAAAAEPGHGHIRQRVGRFYRELCPGPGAALSSGCRAPGVAAPGGAHAGDAEPLAAERFAALLEPDLNARHLWLRPSFAAAPPAAARTYRRAFLSFCKSRGSIRILALRQQFVFADELIRGGLKLGGNRAAVAQL